MHLQHQPLQHRSVWELPQGGFSPKPGWEILSPPLSCLPSPWPQRWGETYALIPASHRDQGGNGVGAFPAQLTGLQVGENPPMGVPQYRPLLREPLLGQGCIPSTPLPLREAVEGWDDRSPAPQAVGEMKKPYHRASPTLCRPRLEGPGGYTIPPSCRADKPRKDSKLRSRGFSASAL